MSLTLLDTLPDSVAGLHRKGWPDHLIASRLRMPIPWVRRERKRLRLPAHPAASRLTPEQLAAAIIQWDRYIWQYAKRWVRRYPHLDLDDVRSEAIAGCLRAGERFDPRRGLAFPTYAEAWMRNQIQRYAEREADRGFRGRVRGKIGTLMPLARVPDDSSLEEMLADHRDAARPPEPMEDLWARLTDGLTDQERQIADMRFRQNLTLREIAARLHLRPHIVNGHVVRSLEWMRKRGE